MRDVNIDRSWSRVAESGLANSVSALRLSGIGGFETQKHAVAGSFFIICGGNAYGKTRLLRSLYRQQSGAQIEFDVQPLTGTAAPEWSYIDPGLLVTRQMFSISADAAVDERVDAGGYVRTKVEVLRQLCYLLGAKYTSFEIVELDADDPDAANLSAWGTSQDLIFASEVIPFFRLARDGRVYTSEEMSQGELVACTLLWALTRSDPGSVLFVEEPDSALSPLSSGRCFDILATYAHKNRFTIFVTSHSATGLAHSPTKQLVLLKRGPAGTSSIHEATPIELRRELEVALEKRVLFVVEDAAGQQWLQALLAERMPGLAPLYEILIAGGESEVKKACTFPQAMVGFRIVICGVYDGDQRQALAKGQKYVAYLPGSVPPEEVIRDYLMSSSAREDLGVHLPLARETYAVTAGDDIHDQLSRVASELGMTVPDLRSTVWRAYADTPAGAKEVSELEIEIRRLPWGDDVDLDSYRPREPNPTEPGAGAPNVSASDGDSRSGHWLLELVSRLKLLGTSRGR